ncbi:hypothetical protein WSK_0847 [Novosphingobium sp. Rr 2-17]|nr:hypothetical protein WSK_0847 [Novosphingobium sp. Rr 2-17]
MDIALSLMVLTVIALVFGGVVLWRRDGYRKQATLMFVLAAVLAGNVVIWVAPTHEGKTLTGEAAKASGTPK